MSTAPLKVTGAAFVAGADAVLLDDHANDLDVQRERLVTVIVEAVGRPVDERAHEDHPMRRTR
ncbi:MAG: hypothetical protein ACR2LI_09580 [Propionibacteriaceae bacterium]